MAQNEKEIFVTQVMRGPRFEGHSVPVDALADLAAYQDLITELARVLFLRQNRGRKYAPKRFEAGFQLSIESIGEGSVVLDLVRTRAAVHGRSGDLFPDPFDQSRDLVNACIESVGRGGELPPEFPRRLASRFNGLGRHMREGESIEIRARGTTVGAQYTPATRKRLVLQSGPGYQNDVELTGYVVEADSEKGTFHLQYEGRRVPIPFEEEHRRIVLAALLHGGKVELCVVGVGLFDEKDRLEKVVFVRDISTVDDGVDKPEFDIARRLGQLADLPEGWLDGEGRRLDAGGLRWLTEFLHSAEATGLARPYLYPTPDAGIQAEWSLPGGVEVSATFDLNRRCASVLGVYTSNGASKEEEIDASQPGAEARLSSFVASFDVGAA